MKKMMKMTMEEMEMVQAHIKMLTELQKSGYNCNREIKEALDKLHLGMFPKEEKDNSKVEEFKRMVANRMNYPVPKGYENDFKLIPVGDKDRGIGKTESLMEMAKKYQLVVVIPAGSRTVYQHHKNKLGQDIVFYTPKEVRGRNIRVLLEEGLSLEELVELKSMTEIQIIGGYISNRNLKTI